MQVPPFQTILLVDGHAIVRRGLRDLVAEDFPRAECGEADSGLAALVEIKRCAWSLVLLDLSLPGLDGLEVLKEALVIRPRLRILIFSAHDEDQYAIRALRAGASGYVTKTTTLDTLTAAMRRVLDGGKYVSPKLAEQMVANLTRGGLDRPLYEGLSDRELQVLRLLAAGRSVKDIGDGLALSEKTISTYRTRILGKMNMNSNGELMRYALDVGLVD